MAFLYRVYNIGLESNVPLPELPPSTSASADCQFIQHEERSHDDEHPWFHHWTYTGAENQDRVWMSIADHPAGFLLRFPDLAEFIVHRAADRVECWPAPGTADYTVRHLLLDQVLPVVLGARGECVLHASGVVAPFNEALVFAAPTGYGKSTLAGSLVKAGCRLLTDDGLLITRNDASQLTACASYPGVRLWDDALEQLYGLEAASRDYAHYTPKRRVDLAENSIPLEQGPVPIRAIYFLLPPTEEGEIEIQPLTPQAAFLELVRFSYTLDVRSRDRLRADFQRFSTLVQNGIFYRLGFPRRWDLIPQVVNAVLDHAASRAKEMRHQP